MGSLEEVSGLMNITSILVIAVFFLLIVYAVWRHTFFLRHGIRGPMPLPIFGHVLDWRKMGIHMSMDETIKKYGDCCGIYRLYSPVMLVSDPEVIKQILVKHFDRFHNRDRFPIDNPTLKNALFVSRDEHWKKIRTAISPAFSGRKMKLMLPLINETASRFVEILDSKCGSDEKGIFECKMVYGAYVMDTIALCAFGLNIDSQGNKDDPFVSHAKRFFASVGFASPLAVLSLLIPGAGKVLRLLGYSVVPEDVVAFFESITNKAIEMRKKDTTEKRVDFLQLVMDAAEKDDDDNDSSDDLDDDVAPSSSEGKSKARAKREPLTKMELMSQALAFFGAGYETTSTALSFASYLLATNPDQQQQLIDEIDRVAPTSDDVTYNKLKELTFLDNVISETLRIYPPAVTGFRVCTQTTTINGHVFPAGASVNFPIWHIHHSPKYWPDPEKFDPNRFGKDRQSEHHPFAWLPFGGGPRICFGMRFALAEIKTALVRLLQEFRLEVAPETEIPPTLGKSGFISPPNGITLRAVKRCN